MRYFLVFFILQFFLNNIRAQQGDTCSLLLPCLEGCCSQYGSCGYGDDFCGDGCIGTCNAIAQCGKYSNTEGTGTLTCPLNVCCSQYGFCGTTEDFCDTGCQSGCLPTVSPSCAAGNASSLTRRIAYYELFALTSRPCDTMQPEAIAAGALTHINLAFILFDDTYNLVDTQGDLVARVSRLKATYPGLRVNAAIGGWAFNDAPTQYLFSNMSSTYENRQTFISSVMSYLTKYGLDGIDIDWEYPGASDRGGVPADTDNYVLLVSDIQEAFAMTNPGWEVTITLPSSYWYLQNFDLNSLQKYVSWFNFMSYDLHGSWDQLNEYTGPYLLGHTNLTQIDEGFQLLWRNGILPENVVMGFGFYGRSFTMTDPSCTGPTCTFSGPGAPGDCSGTAGILIYAEIVATNQSLNTETFYDPVSTVKYNVYGGNQWISYDDQQSFTDKMTYLTSHCLSGAMIWAIDEDDPQYDALTGLLGEEAMQGSLVQGGALTNAQRITLASQFSAYTGQDCFITEVCTDGSSGQLGSDQVCPAGFSAVSTAHAPLQKAGYTIDGACSEGWYRQICCPTAAMPQNCAWNGAPIRSEIGCSGFCGSDQFQLNIDTYTDAAGDEECYQGQRTLCCDNTEVLTGCIWTSCQGPLLSAPECPSGMTYMTQRYDDGVNTCVSDRGDNAVNELSFSQAYCCPTTDVPSNCSWTFQPNTPTGVLVEFNPEVTCNPSSCDPSQVLYTTALDPPNPFIGSGSLEDVDCNAYPPPAGENPLWPYCCNPPEAYNEKWPVDPTYLWADADDSTDEVLWSYVDNFGNNALESAPKDGDGNDPYGFIMLDGAAGSLSDTFDSDFTVARRDEHISTAKRSLITTNKTLIDTVFEHSEETLYVFCNHPNGSPKCENIFYRGAEDTVVRLPNHIGEGPFARVVSMIPAEESYVLPTHHLVKRSAQGNSNPVYKVVIDYNFHLIKRTDPVNMRVDFTNLLEYWGDVTDTPARKRSVEEEHMPYKDWKAKVKSAKKSHRELRKRQKDVLGSSQIMERDETQDTGVGKRWFGAFLSWLQKLNTVETSNIGYLNMAFQQSILLYRAMIGCSKTNAQLNIYLDTQAAMDATYAYYFSGTIVPPAITGTYAYFGVDPSIYLGLTITGSARMQYTSARQPLIATLSYPGLAIKGIASVGPTLDIFGQIIGVIQIAGTMQIGATYNFEKCEVYFPEDTDSAGYQTIQDLVGDPEPVESGIVPVFNAAVTASADLDILVTPEAHIGISVGGSGTFGYQLVDAQITAYVNNTLRFHADVLATATLSGATLAYNYGVYLLYNIGYGGYATIPLYTWAMTSQNLFAIPKIITLYSNGDVLSTDSSSSTKRHEFDDAVGGVLNSIDGAELTEPDQGYVESKIVSFEDGKISYLPGPILQPTSNYSMPLFRRDDAGSESIDDGEAPDFSLANSFTCPATTCTATDGTESGAKRRAIAACPSTLPDFKINCGVFRDAQANGNGVSDIVPGICTNILKFYNNRGIQNTDTMTLTWDAANADARRTFVCGLKGPFCVTQNAIYEREFNLPSGTLGISSCDEYPFAGTEEGGSYFGTLLLNPTSSAATCVPAYQQTIQGSCNKLLSGLSTNVAYADGGSSAAAVWQLWGGGGLNVQPSWNLPTTSWQRIVQYPQQIPAAQNIGASYGPFGVYPAQTWGGYYQKRNFTFGMVWPTSATDGAAWGTQAFSSYTLSSGGGISTDATTIACSINIFGQNDIYKIGDYNGWCLNPSQTNTAPGYNTIPAFVACLITFAPSATTSTTKRDIIGQWQGMDIESITIVDTPEEIVEAPDFVHDGSPMLPVNIVKGRGFRRMSDGSSVVV